MQFINYILTPAEERSKDVQALLRLERSHPLQRIANSGAAGATALRRLESTIVCT